MKHVLALLFSLMLMLGPAVPSSNRSIPARDHCSMKAAAACARCSCCVAPAGRETPQPARDSVPAPDNTVRWHLVAGLLSALPTLQLDSIDPRPAAAPHRPLPQFVPLYQRHCLLLI